MYGNQRVRCGSRHSIQMLAATSLIVLAACVPRSGDILKISGEVGKASKNLQALVEAETGSYSRSLRLKYGRAMAMVNYKKDKPSAEERAHILEGLKIALGNLDDVIALIRRATSPEEARSGLVQDFQLTTVQASAILDMRLQRLTQLEREKLIQEYQDLLVREEKDKSSEEFNPSEEMVAELFAHFACAGIPISSKDMDLARTLARQNKDLAEFHSVLEKAAKRAENDAKGVEELITSVQKITIDKERKDIVPISSYEYEKMGFDKSLSTPYYSKPYYQCFKFARDVFKKKPSLFNILPDKTRQGLTETGNYDGVKGARRYHHAGSYQRRLGFGPDFGGPRLS